MAYYYLPAADCCLPWIIYNAFIRVNSCNPWLTSFCRRQINFEHAFKLLLFIVSLQRGAACKTYLH